MTFGFVMNCRQAAFHSWGKPRASPTLLTHSTQTWPSHSHRPFSFHFESEPKSGELSCETAFLEGTGGFTSSELRAGNTPLRTATTEADKGMLAMELFDEHTGDLATEKWD